MSGGTAEERRARAGRRSSKRSRPAPNAPCTRPATKAVFGAGNADAELMFVGEAPGAEEDRQGLPFVGRAGQLLNQLLEEIGLSREDVFIANVLKSRPPGNRDPQPLEIEACEPYLFEQVRLIEPRVVCTLGNFATKLLSGSPAGITKVRGTPQVHELGGRTVFLLPLLPPGRGAAHAGGEGDAARRLRDDSRRCSPARRRRRRRAPRRSTTPTEAGGAAAAAAACRRPARLLRLSGRGDGSRASSAAETEALGRAHRRAAAAGRRRRRQRRGRGRQDDPDPRRLPRARGRGAGHLADLHDRPALRRRPPAGLPPRPLPAGRASRARTRRCSTTTSAPTASPSSSGRRPGPSASAGRRWRSGSRTPAASGARSRSTGNAQPRSHAAASGAGVFREQRTQLVASAQTNCDPRREGLNEGTEGACGGAGRHRAAGERGARHRPGRRRTSTTSPAGSRATRNRRTSARRGARRAPSSKASTATSTTASASSSRAAKTSARKTRKRTGDALREQDHLDHPRQAPGDLVRRRARKSAPSSSGSRARERRCRWSSSASTPRPPTPPPAPGATARSCTSRCWGSPPTGGRGTRPRCSARSSAPPPPAGGWERGRADRGRARARLLHRPADRDRHRARARRQPRPAGARRLHPRRARRGDRRGGRRGRAPGGPRRLPRRGLRGALLAGGRADLGAVRLPRRRSSRSGSPQLPAPPPAAGSGAVRFRHELAGARRPDRGRRRSRPPGRRAARLRSRGGAGRRGRRTRSTRSTSDLQTRSGGVSEILSREPSEADAARSGCAGSPTATCRR